MDYKKLGERIRQARKALHYSQAKSDILYRIFHM